MVIIPAGDFIFGVSSESELRRWDIPAQIVNCSTFFIAIDETSTAEYKRFILDGGYTNADYWSSEGNRFREKYRGKLYDRYPEGTDPCAGISFYEAEAYCRWLAAKTGEPFRLPTEIEWEKAARGTDRRIFPWGNQWNPKACNWNDDTDGDLKPDGKLDGYIFTAGKRQYPEGISPYGCYDMAGNIHEWCNSRFENTPFHVLRGGHYWMAYPRFFQTNFRMGAPPETGMVFHAVTGFRIAKTWQE